MKQLYTFSFLLLLLLVACGAEAEPTAVENPSPRDESALPQENPITLPSTDEESASEGEKVTVITQQAPVESMELLMLESFPLQINVQVTGYLPDGCTTLGTVNQSRSGNTIFVRIPTERDPEAMCTEAIVPFEQIVSLEVENLTAGTYTVDVNGLTDTFTLDMDNAPVKDPFEACNFTDPTAPSYVNVELGYCLQHPLGFIAEEAVAELVIVREMEPTEAGISLSIEAVQEDGRSTTQLAEDFLSNWSNGTEGVMQTEQLIDGETMIVADGVPGTVDVRVGFVVYNGTVYTFTLYPSDPDQPEATARADELWQAVINSFDFTQ